MKLYYAPGACSLADHVALIEADLPYDLVKVDLRTKQTENGEDYAAINPKGYVPALRLDDGPVLTENIAILSYIADTAGRLMPTDGLGRYRVLETTAYISTEIHKSFKPFFNPAASDAEKDEARKMLAKRYGLLADRTAADGFVAGSEPTIADCYLFVTLLWSTKNEVVLPEALTAYLDRLKARPAFARALKEEGLAG